MIPNLIHFIYGLDQEFSKKPFSFIHNLAIKSAKNINKCEIVIHYHYEPQNEFWEEIKPHVSLNKINNVPSQIHGNPVLYPEHICDLLRLEILYECGGIYLDIDTICIDPFTSLFSHTTVMGMEIFNKTINGLCNAVILCEKNSPFIKHWIDSFSEFNPYHWNKMAVEMPYELSLKYPNLIEIEPYVSFFKYDWHNIIDIFNGDSQANLSGALSLHLWESKLFHPILKHITKEDILNRECLFNTYTRSHLNFNV
jgi:hypothetical protein